MADSPTPPSGDGSSIINRMGDKVGPLPKWAWVIVIGGVVYFFVLRKSSTSSSTATTTPTGDDDPSFDTGRIILASNIGSAPSPTTTTPTPTPKPPTTGGTVSTHDMEAKTADVTANAAKYTYLEDTTKGAIYQFNPKENTFAPLDLAQWKEIMSKYFGGKTPPLVKFSDATRKAD